MRLFGRRVLSRLEEAQMFAAGVEVARLRRDNKLLLEELGDIRMLYEACCNDRERAIELLNGFTGPERLCDAGRGVALSLGHS